MHPTTKYMEGKTRQDKARQGDRRRDILHQMPKEKYIKQLVDSNKNNKGFLLRCCNPRSYYMYCFYYYYYYHWTLLLLAGYYSGVFTVSASPGNFQQQRQKADSRGVAIGIDHREEPWLGRSSRVYELTDAVNSTCDEAWTSWPSMQDDAVRDGTFIVFKVFDSVGNLFWSLNELMTVVRFLDLGIILDWRESFQGFGEAFEPAEIIWDVDPAPWWQKALEVEQSLHRPSLHGNTSTSGFHAITFTNGAVVLSDNQLTRLLSVMHGHASSLPELVDMLSISAAGSGLRRFLSGIYSRLLRKHVGVRVEPCARNLLLHRSARLVDASETYSPWIPRDSLAGASQHPSKYIAWHIRTGDVETMRSYDPSVHNYILQQPSEVVCESFLEATGGVRQACPILFPDNNNDVAHHGDDGGDLYVYISSTSKSMARTCIEDTADHRLIGSQVDMGLDDGDAHTHNSKHPEAALNAFLDFVFLIDATVIIRTSSSFSGSAAKIGGLNCAYLFGNQLSHNGMSACSPEGVTCLLF